VEEVEKMTAKEILGKRKIHQIVTEWIDGLSNPRQNSLLMAYTHNTKYEKKAQSLIAQLACIQQEATLLRDEIYNDAVY